ncbi:MAG: DNA-methyltransferase [Sphingomonas pseudosanguinis]|uniref:DNA-methyltransferase n=1 Tax=Sphingomonas pseudosanguinis TaxID=413712 RepID=UPI00391B0957
MDHSEGGSSKLAAELPDMIEEAADPVRWRLRSPSYIKPVADTLKKARLSAKGRRSEPAAPANDMPPAAITDVRERVLAETPPMQMFAPVLHHANCFDAMKSIPDGSIDLILTDPPYATTGLDIDPLIDLTALWAEYRRIVKSTGTIIMFGSQPFTSRLVWEARDLFKHDLVWIKNRATGSLQARNRPLKQHEDVLIFSMGTTIHRERSARRYAYNALGQASAGMKKISMGKHSAYLHDVKHYPGRVYEGTTNNPRTTLFCSKDKGNLHPFQKPLDLLEYLIRTYSTEGDTVLDTFMGSGGTCVAAMRSGRRAIGIEMTAKYFRVAKERIAAQARDAVIEDSQTVPLIEAPTASRKSANDNARAPLPTACSNEVSIYDGDCLDIMRQMPSRSVDLVFTSPPYNLGRSSGGRVRGAAKSGKWKGMALSKGYASYDDARDPADYIEWQKDVLRECWRLLRDDGAIYYNHKPRVQNGVLQTPLDLNPGLPVRQIVIWDRRSGFNFNQSFYLPTHEWVVIFAKPGFRLRSKGASGLKDVWSVPHERENEHPAPFPVELAQKAIETTSARVILDPFMGSGSTGVAALQSGREFIGIELDPGYCEKARARMGVGGDTLAA